MLSRKRKALGVHPAGTKQDTFATSILAYFEHIEFPSEPRTSTEKKQKIRSTRGANEPLASNVNASTNVKPASTTGDKKTKGKKAKNNNEDVDQYSERTEVVDGIMVMNPYKNPVTLQIFARFMKTYFSDNNQRVFVLGINPSRLGGGLTGIPFTEPRNIKDKLNIDFPGLDTLFGKSRREPSGQFIYNFIDAYGGPTKFFSRFYITSLSPLGFTKAGVNYNFYDSVILRDATMPFILSSLRAQIPCGASKKVAICLGTGKLQEILLKINQQHHFFDDILAVEHPRYIVQYKGSRMQEYLQKYMQVFDQAWQLSGIPTPPSIPSTISSTTSTSTSTSTSTATSTSTSDVNFSAI